ncbi:MAG: exodeoxyribonuclease VII large subunit [Bacteroidota bacterium]
MDLFNQFDETVLTVSEITDSVKKTLERSFSGLKIVGEISNFKAHFSGHWYFTLKDANAQISCTMWRGFNSKVFFTPQDGMKVIVNGSITVYPPRGNYQIDVKSMKVAGEGELQAAFEKLKRKLSDEGLFDEELKQPIPKFPTKIGIVTAIDSAAYRDMVSVASRRYPLVELIVASSRVQGEGAAEEIAQNIKLLDSQKDIDLIIIGRGGGSLEDLWAFNEEIVALSLFECRTPVISGVGHEIDFTIADFVADLRAPTPTAAMELATPDQAEIFGFISDFSYTSTNNIFSVIDYHKEDIESILTSYGFRAYDSVIRNKSQMLDNLIYRMQNGTDQLIDKFKNDLEKNMNLLESHNVEKILKKGFALVKQDESFILRAKDFDAKKKTKLKFFDNEIKIN